MKSTEESLKMRKNKEKVTLSVALIVLIIVSTFVYMIYIQRQIFDEEAGTCWKRMSR